VDHVAALIVNANHSVTWAAVKVRVPNGVRDGIGTVIPQATKRQRIGDQIDATFIFARTDFVNVSRASHHDGSYHFVVAVWRAKESQSNRMKDWEIIADNLSKAGWAV
jgi:hypothetical protein